MCSCNEQLVSIQKGNLKSWSDYARPPTFVLNWENLQDIRIRFKGKDDPKQQPGSGKLKTVKPTRGDDQAIGEDSQKSERTSYMDPNCKHYQLTQEGQRCSAGICDFLHGTDDCPFAESVL